MKNLQYMDDFEQGIICFNKGEFYKAHEVWERIWQNKEEDKVFLKGLIQIAAGYYHYTKGNIKGKELMLTRGSKYLSNYPGNFKGIDVLTLISDVQKTLSEDEISYFPRIKKILLK